jgi:hypothetical protein
MCCRTVGVAAALVAPYSYWFSREGLLAQLSAPMAAMAATLGYLARRAHRILVTGTDQEVAAAAE